MTKLKQIAMLSALAGVSLLAGCRQDMHDQPKFFPQRGTDFYADGRSVRPQVENTVARGQLRENAYFYTGLINGKEGDGMPFPATLEVLERGQERFNVYCTPCHSRVGNGEGMIVQRGYMKAGNFHTARLETAPLGHFFHVGFMFSLCRAQRLRPTGKARLHAPTQTRRPERPLDKKHLSNQVYRSSNLGSFRTKA